MQSNVIQLVLLSHVLSMQTGHNAIDEQVNVVL
jgi:hypothetical protein